MRSTRTVPATPAILIVALALAVAQSPAAQPAARLALQLEDYVQMPITGELDGQNTRGLLARVNFLRDEPGGRRFFVNDLNGPLYILDKERKTFTTYLDFNGAGGRTGLFRRFTFERNFATSLLPRRAKRKATVRRAEINRPSTLCRAGPEHAGRLR